MFKVSTMKNGLRNKLRNPLFIHDPEFVVVKVETAPATIRHETISYADRADRPIVLFFHECPLDDIVTGDANAG